VSILTSISQRFWRPDPRSPAEIDAEVVEELSFHLEMRARDLLAEGLAPEEARRAAEERFGDFDSIRRQCRAVHLEERAVLQRVQTVLIVCLLVTVGAMAWGMVRTKQRSRQELDQLRAELEQVTRQHQDRREPLGSLISDPALLERLDDETRSIAFDMENRLAASTSLAGDAIKEQCSDEELDAQDWIALFAERPTDWRRGWALAERIARLPPEEGALIMTEIWPSLTPEVKRQALKPFVFDGGHPKALVVLHLAATDADMESQSRALEYLREYAFRDFTADYEGYLAWAGRWKNAPLADVLRENALELVQRLGTLRGEALEQALTPLERLDFANGEAAGVDVPGVLRTAGGLQLLERMLAEPSAELQTSAMKWAGKLEADEAWLRANVLPVIGGERPVSEPTLTAALESLGRPACAFARDPVLDLMQTRLARMPELREGDDPDANAGADGTLWSGARALSEMGDPAAIPGLIAMIAKRPCYDTVYGIGYFGLSKLTGVDYDESHDGAWWLAWWEANKLRLPESVRGMTIPLDDH
jgi:hypothetical protein